MQLRRAMEIVNEKNNNYNNNVVAYYQDQPVNIISVDNNIGTAYVQALDKQEKFEVDLGYLSEINK